jgi:hypothetical protein
MNPFSVFALFYMTAVFLEMAEGWEDPRFTIGFLLISTLIIVTRVTRIGFLVFLVLATAYFLIGPFPEVANHVNLILYCNIVMMVAMIYSFVRYRDFATDNDYFEMIRSVLRASLILVYVLAGFHKLNRDFLDPHVSCAGGMLSNIVSMMQSHILGVPSALVLAAWGLFVIWRLIGVTRFVALGPRATTLLLILCVGGALCGALIILLEARFGTPAALRLSAALATAILVICWELIGGLLLAVPRFQVAILPFSLTMHAVLAMVGFVDFGALAFSLLFTFG